MNKFIVMCAVLAALIIVIDANKEEVDCFKGLPLNREDIEALNVLTPLPENNPHLSQYLSCVYTNNGVITRDGFDWDKFFTIYFKEVLIRHKKFHNLRRKALEQAVYKIVQNCKAKNLVGISQGQTIIKIKNCVQKDLDGICAQFHSGKH